MRELVEREKEELRKRKEKLGELKKRQLMKMK